MADRILFVCIVVLVGVYFWATQQIPTLEIGDPLGPKAFPRLLGIGLLITAGVLLIEILRDRKTAKGKPTQDAPAQPINYPIVIGTVVATLLFFLAFESVGYLISVSIYLLLMMNFFNPKGRWLVNSLTAIIYGAGSYYAFTQLLGVNLPRGISPF